jgi:ubiquitin-like 1-activating enzyme E1 B
VSSCLTIGEPSYFLVTLSSLVSYSRLSSLNRLAARLKSGKEKTISFDKDDDDTLDFVTATANLRAFCYGIPTKTRWEVKGIVHCSLLAYTKLKLTESCTEMAGNIIPAIATTNAIISGLIVLQALHVIRDQSSSSTLASSSKDSTLRNVFLQSGKPSVPLGSYGFEPPNQFCGVCRETYISVQCDFDKVTLGSLVDAVLEAESKEDGEDEKRIVSVYEEGRILSDPDWDDNLGRTLSDLNCGKGKFVTVVDDDERVGNLVLCLGELT